MMRTSTIVGLLILVCLPLRAHAQVLTSDRDSDGVVDWEDNCPEVPNPDQIDSDAEWICPPKGECGWVSDGFGDVCDDCPTSMDDTDCDPTSSCGSTG
ncbi:MAG: thrombospondin type 3 repeat-containing protein [Deltaproteobacteria bacterium]|nr:thrombospondin type 3 repeat-containing protein [Deltaproteobacteria bacterium]